MQSQEEPVSPLIPCPAAATVLLASAGEHQLQNKQGSQDRARTFYERQVLDHLNERMSIFVGRQSMMFIATADGAGGCDCSFRAGLPGFVHVLDERTLIYPEYRGNGVVASLGNISKNPHWFGFIDFFRDIIGLHVNGHAAMLDNVEVCALNLPPAVREAAAVKDGRRPAGWGPRRRRSGLHPLLEAHSGARGQG